MEDSIKHVAKKLASNDLRSRNKGVKVATAILRNPAAVNLTIFLKLWKALFYCMWHSDKPLVQHELAGKLAKLVHVPNEVSTSLLYLKSFYITMEREWEGIDHLRLDKFYTLIRFMLRETFELLKQRDWNIATIHKLNEVLLESPFRSISKEGHGEGVGIVNHLADIFLDEYKKHEVPESAAKTLLEPFFYVLSQSQFISPAKRVSELILRPILQEHRRPLQDSAEDDGANIVPAISLPWLTNRLFELASAKGTNPSRRNELYKQHKVFKSASAKLSGSKRKHEEI